MNWYLFGKSWNMSKTKQLMIILCFQPPGLDDLGSAIQLPDESGQGQAPPHGYHGSQGSMQSGSHHGQGKQQ